MEQQKPHAVPKYWIHLFFILGLISVIAFRGIIVFQHLAPDWVRPVWYIGTIGYLFFFLYRYLITRKRKHAIDHYQLIEKLKANTCLAGEDRDVLLYLLSSLKFSLEDINYALIFVLSVIAITVDIFLTAMKV